MTNILALLHCIQPNVSKTNVRRLSVIIEAMLSMTGRITMLGISRWAGEGGSYRTVQRFFNTEIPWAQIFCDFFKQHLHRKKGEYFLVGDESIVTKSGKKTHGVDYFFSGLMNKVVKSIAIFCLSLVSVEERHSYPLQVKQVVRTKEQKAAARACKKKKKQAKKSKAKKKRGRPKGSKNRDKTKVELTPELVNIQKMIKKQLAVLNFLVTINHLVLDGYFGNNNALQMVRQCDLHLISKLRHDSALHFVYDGKQKKKGPRKIYGKKIDYRNIPEKYLVDTSTEKGIETRIYHLPEMLHSIFAQRLNVVIITKTNLTTGAFANVNLFSSDLELAYEKIIDWYSLRFQIEFNFRDAKQHWGLEDFMNVNEVPLTNALNLSMFMDNLSQVLLRDFRETHPESGVLDLKSHFRAAKYFEETIKRLPEKPDPILLDRIFSQVASLGCIHPVDVPISPP